MDPTKEKCYRILLEIDRICRLHGLKYYIYAGTLLGAVRHNGFIPWDDDIDVVMMREDYDRFPDACRQSLNHEQYELQTILSDPYANNPWMKLHDKNTAFISGVRRTNAMEGINVDIFPLDNAPNCTIVLKIRSIIIDSLNFIYQYRFLERNKNASLKMRCFQSMILLLPPQDEMTFKLKYDRYIQRWNTSKCENVVYLSNRKYLRKVIPKKFFDNSTLLQFESHYFPAPKMYHEILLQLYGTNYMLLPPKEQRVTVHGCAVLDLNNSWRKYRRTLNGYKKI